MPEADEKEPSLLSVSGDIPSKLSSCDSLDGESSVATLNIFNLDRVGGGNTKLRVLARSSSFTSSAKGRFACAGSTGEGGKGGGSVDALRLKGCVNACARNVFCEEDSSSNRTRRDEGKGVLEPARMVT